MKTSMFLTPVCWVHSCTRSAAPLGRADFNFRKEGYLVALESPGSECVGTAAAVQSPKHRNVGGIARRGGCGPKQLKIMAEKGGV